jgi:nucleotide-binding universal stress UspA family protein
MKALLAVDGSDDTKQMLAYLAAHDELLGASPQLHVLNVQTKIPPHAANRVGKQVVEEYYHAEAEAVFKPVAKFLDRHGWSYKTERRVGHAAEEILAAAKKSKVDLIVIGTKGRGGLGGLLLGSVAQKVLSSADVPVMVIR